MCTMIHATINIRIFIGVVKGKWNLIINIGLVVRYVCDLSGLQILAIDQVSNLILRVF